MEDGFTDMSPLLSLYAVKVCKRAVKAVGTSV